MKLARTHAFLLLGTIAALPLLVRSVTKDPFDLASLNIWSIALVLLGLIVVAKKELPLHLPKDWLFWTLLTLFVFGIGWANLHTHPVRNAFGLDISRTLLPALLGYFFFLHIESGSITKKDLQKTLVAVLTVISALALAHLTKLLPEGDINRFTGLFDSANSFARYVAQALLLTLPYILLESGIPKLTRRTLWILWITTLLTLIGTLSFGGAFSLLIGACVFFVIVPKKWSYRIAVFAILLVGLSTGYAVVQKVPQLHSKYETSLASRREYWKVAHVLVSDNLWTGIGIKGWEKAYPEKVIPVLKHTPIEWISPQPHNMFYDALLKGGIPMLVGTLSLLGLLFTAGLRILQRTPRHWFGLALISSAFALLAFGFADDPIWGNDIATLIWVLIGAGFGFAATLKRTPLKP